jgi:hypothetical protein
MATRNKNLSYGLGSPLIDVFPTPIASQRAPLTSDKMEVGQVWVDQPNDDVYVLTRIVANNALWLGVGGGIGTFTSLAVSPGNIVATLGNITATAGSLTAGTTILSGTGITSTTGDIVASAGNLSATLGNVGAGGSVTAGTTVSSGTLMTAGDALTVTTGLVTITDLSTAGILSNTAAGVVQSTAGTNGQIIFGATGAAPAWGTLASADGSVTLTPGANSLDLSASGVDMTIHTDGADATEATDAFTIAGTANEIATAGAGSTVTLSFTANPQISDTLTIGTGLTVSAGGFNVTGDSKVIDELMTENNEVNATGAALSIQKNRAGGVITTGDVLGRLSFWGDDGTSYISGAYIKSTTSGTIATDRIPANMEFYTHPDSVAGTTLRMDIDTAGKITIAAPDAGTALTVSGGGISSTGGIVETANDIEAATATKGFICGSGCKIIDGSGSPNAAITAPKGSLYLRTDGSGVNDRAYINTDGAQAWTALTTAA